METRTRKLSISKVGGNASAGSKELVLVCQCHGLRKWDLMKILEILK